VQRGSVTLRGTLYAAQCIICLLLPIVALDVVIGLSYPGAIYRALGLTLRYKGIRQPPILDTLLDKSNINLKIAHNNTMTIVDCYVPAAQTMSKFMGCPLA
jgi:hypothetical protein